MGQKNSTDSTDSVELMLEDHARAARVGQGQNPYDTFPNVRHTGLAQRQADLRRLSDWIRMKRQLAQLKKSDS